MIQNDAPSKVARGRAVCVAPDREAAEAGAQALRDGGNAFDAVVAAGFMEAVVAPQSCGIGGYGATGIGFLAEGEKLVALDANAVAPAGATPRMFPTIPTRDPNDYKLPDTKHRRGPLSVAVPGVTGGLLAMLETWGRLPRKAVMAAAIRKAREGILMTPGQALVWNRMKAEAEGVAPPARPEGEATVRLPELAETLEAIASEGAEVFYAGRIGRAIADHLRKIGGIVSRDDMAAYRALVVEPVAVTVRGHVVATPPPASGGLTSLQILALMDRLRREGRGGGPGSAAEFEAFLEVLKVAWEERLTTLADPKGMGRPPADLLTDGHLDAMKARVLEGLAHPGPGRLIAPDPLRGTVHLAAADAEGNVFAWTQTHGGSYGSEVMVPGTGVVLGHGMCRFEPRPGWPNSVGPGKRPLHNMSPLIAVREGRCVLATGASGGRTIVNNSAATATLRLLHGLGPADAVRVPRLQCESLEPAAVERSAGAEVIELLRRRGHTVTEVNRDAGSVHLIARDGDAWVGAAEPRGPRSAAIAIEGR
jgi:gamma-glutamyltranspeptidase / glutathione hydrolase